MRDIVKNIKALHIHFAIVNRAKLVQGNPHHTSFSFPNSQQSSASIENRRKNINAIPI